MQCPRIKGKDYEQSDATPILNVMRDELNSIYGNPFTGLTNGVWNIHLLHKDNVADFKKFWGKQSCTWVGNGRFWIWKHEFENCDLYCLSCSTVGTSYEIVMRGNENAAKIEVKQFLQQLCNNLRDIMKSEGND